MSQEMILESNAFIDAKLAHLTSLPIPRLRVIIEHQQLII